MRYPSEQLFELIQSLTPSEKRYFKLYATRHRIGNQNNYVQLFDVIAEQKNYDEEKVVEQLKEKPFINRLSSEKVYLYQLILKSMNAFHAESSIDSKLLALLHKIEFLYNKGLYHQCLKIISKAKILARKYEKHIYLYELMRWETDIHHLQSYQEISVKELEDIYSEMFEIANRINNFTTYHHLFTHMSVSFLKDGMQEQKDAVKTPSMHNATLFDDINNAKSFQAKILHYACLASYYYMRTNDFEMAYHYSSLLIMHIEENLHQINENPYHYVFALNLLTTTQLSQKNYKEAEISINKLKAIQPKSKHLQELLFYAIANQELNRYIGQGAFEEAVKRVKSIKDVLHDFPQKHVRKQRVLMLYYHITYIYFGVNNLKEAIRWINIIINDASLTVRNDIYCFSRIINLIIHYEKKNYDYIAYEVNATNRFLSKQHRLYKVEEVLIAFFEKSLPMLQSVAEEITALKALKKAIIEITKNTVERQALDYFDFISWLDSKIEGRPFAEVVRGKLVES